LEEAFSTTAPTSLDDGLSDHVVVCSDTARSAALIEELDSREIPYAIVEPDADRAVRLHEAGRTVVRADPESVEGLAAANLADARALVTDVSDQVDASIVLAAKELSPAVRVISVVEDSERERYHRLAGADEVLSPRTLLGESLAAKVTTALQTDLDEAIAIGDSLRLAEVSVPHGSPLAGSTLADSDIRERVGANVIGAWFNGEFEAAPPPDATLSAGTVLLASGRPDQLERLVDLTNSATRRFGAGETVVVGYGQVGRTVTEAVAAAGLSVTVVDREGGEGVDVVGDATDPETLRAAGVETAQTVVLALPDDTTTEFTTLVVRDMAPDTQVIARVEEAASVRKMHRAGADYVLSLATVTGRLSASTVIEDRDVLSLNQQIEVVRSRVPELSGETIGRANVRETTGCTVIAIENGDETLTDIGPDTRIGPDDELVVVGTDEGIRAFERRFA
jgi:Trk K+ transport system NAD-binding subunit